MGCCCASLLGSKPGARAGEAFRAVITSEQLSHQTSPSRGGACPRCSTWRSEGPRDASAASSASDRQATTSRSLRCRIATTSPAARDRPPPLWTQTRRSAHPSWGWQPRGRQIGASATSLDRLLFWAGINCIQVQHLGHRSVPKSESGQSIRQEAAAQQKKKKKYGPPIGGEQHLVPPQQYFGV